MLSRQEEEAERIETLRNDLLVQQQQKQQREQAGTFFSHAQAAVNDTAGGRYASVSPITVVGADPTLKYPAAGPHQRDPVGVEPPLGVSVDAMPGDEPSAGLSAAEHLGAPAAAVAPPSELVPPLADDVEPGAGAPPFSEQTTNK
jgi:hypothetical protein